MTNLTKNTEKVKQQYSDDKNLSARIKLHSKHSINKQGFTAWLWEQYSFFNNCRILELGCGNGAQWENRIDDLPTGCDITLSDFSDGMVSIVADKYKSYDNFTFQQIDIQDIPFPDATFDVVIANHMLYHVPDLSKALAEAKRVLKPKGKFYSSTFGEKSVHAYLHNVFKRFHSDTKAYKQQWSFVLQNGAEILGEHFSDVVRLDYEDALAVTETQDLIDWIKSTILMANCTEQEIQNMFDYFEDIRKKDGAIHIPKEAGLFISSK